MQDGEGDSEIEMLPVCLAVWIMCTSMCNAFSGDSSGDSSGMQNVPVDVVFVAVSPLVCVIYLVEKKRTYLADRIAHRSLPVDTDTSRLPSLRRK